MLLKQSNKLNNPISHFILRRRVFTLINRRLFTPQRSTQDFIYLLNTYHLILLQTSADAPYIARHVGLRSGAKIETPALTVNRLCGSGFQAVVSGAQVK